MEAEDGAVEVGICRPCGGDGYLCKIETHNVVGCPPTCQMDRLPDEECPWCKGTGTTPAYAPSRVERRCKHPRLEFYCEGYFIRCEDCRATWGVYAVTLGQRLRCETGAAGRRDMPAALVQLAKAMEE